MSASTVVAALLSGDELFDVPGEVGYPFELIDGVMIRMPGSGARHTGIGARCLRLVGYFADENDLGIVSGADGGYFIERDPDTILIPDVSFNRTERIPADGVPIRFWPVPPDLAVEVVSPSDGLGRIAAKVARHQRAEVPLVWVLNPDTRTAIADSLGRSPVELGPDDSLDGGDVLPGFRLPLADLYRGC